MGNTTTADAYFCDITNNLFDNNTTHVYNKATYPVPLMISNKNYWTKNKFNGGTTGYRQDYGDCNTIRDNTFENMTNAIVISKGRKNSIVDNYIDSTVSGTGITIGANAGGDCAYNYHFNPQNDAATPLSDQGGAPMYDGRVQSRGVYVVNTAKMNARPAPRGRGQARHRGGAHRVRRAPGRRRREDRLDGLQARGQGPRGGRRGALGDRHRRLHGGLYAHDKRSETRRSSARTSTCRSRSG
jgi:hypothetical protein